jgi:4-amino-4-deoxy-L-arabinose transferase-like glycosyltransferase
MYNLFMGISSGITDTYSLISKKSENFRPTLLLVPLTLALLLRLPLLIWPEVIYNDSTIYVLAAKGILEGKWTETVVPPFYPMLIATAQFVTGDFEMAGILISVIFGTLLVIPVFYLGRELYDARVGMIAALLATVQPYLFKYSGSVLTESIYYFLVAAIILTALRSFNTGKPFYALLFGALTAVGYLVRPEAIGFLAVFGAWILLVNPVHTRRPFARRTTIVLLAGLCFIAFSSPYLVLLRKELGRWELSKKVSVTMGVAEGDDMIEILPGEAFKKQHLTVRSFLNNPFPFVKAVAFGIFQAFYKFQQSFNPLLFLLAIIGFVRKKGSFIHWRQNLFVLSFALFFFALVFPMFKISPRYTSHMIPLTLPWAAYGFMGITEFIRSRDKVRRYSGKTICIILLFIIAGLLVQGVVQRRREHRVVQKQAGLWLKHNIPRGEKLMSRTVQEAFYAGMELIRMPEGDFEHAIETARSRSVRYIVIDEKAKKHLLDFSEKADQQGLVFLHSWKRGERTISVFEIVRLPVGEQGKLAP